MQVFCVFLFLMLLTAVSGCGDGESKKHLSKGKMEAILYDFHVADAMSDIHDDYKDTLRIQVYKQAVLKKHGISEADFDSSMVYYTRHADEFYEIYERLSKRLADEALILGTSASEANRYMTVSNTGDTANIWSGDRSFILTTHPGFNAYSFTLSADTAFKAGDRFMLSFDTKFIYQDGMRNGVALLSVTFGNDSVASSMIRMSADNNYRLNLTDGERNGIKRVSGYFLLLNSQEFDSRSTLRLMHVGNIALVRMHSSGEEKPQEEPLLERRPLRDEPVSDERDHHLEQSPEEIQLIEE